MVNPRLIAFYLPQFHPVPENDAWWGPGFTEWTNVTRARPLFEGHYQPHLPADLGFYDLRVRETRQAQVALARQYGIYGFCYHYYWFSGRKLLNRPLEDMLADPDADFPFCVCWANENWTRRWDAADHEVLIAQQYLPDDDENFIRELALLFADPRYIRVDGKPLLIVYRPQHLPDPAHSAAVWRRHCRETGIGEIHISAALTHGNETFESFGYDSGVEFPPHNIKRRNVNAELAFHDVFKGSALQFAAVARAFLDRDYNGARVFRTVFPSWDNTARTRERAVLMLNGEPDNYEYWLAATIDRVRGFGENDPVVFINAWNEWAEGCHLEPDQRHGHAFLNATRRVLDGERRFTDFPYQDLPAGAREKRRFWRDLGEVFGYHLWKQFGNLKLAINTIPWLRNLLLPLVRLYRRVRAKLGGHG